MYSPKPVLDQFSGHIYLEKLLCKFQQNVNSYMFWTFCIEEWLEVRSHSGLIILTQFQTLPLKRIDRGESLLLPWYAPDHPDPVQPVSVVRDRLAGFQVHLLTQRKSCFVPGPTPSSWQPSEPPFPVYQLFQFQPQPLQLQFNMCLLSDSFGSTGSSWLSSSCPRLDAAAALRTSPPGIVQLSSNSGFVDLIW